MSEHTSYRAVALQTTCHTIAACKNAEESRGRILKNIERIGRQIPAIVIAFYLVQLRKQALRGKEEDERQYQRQTRNDQFFARGHVHGNQVPAEKAECVGPANDSQNRRAAI